MIVKNKKPKNQNLTATIAVVICSLMLVTCGISYAGGNGEIAENGENNGELTPIIFGDVDNTGSVGISDAILMLRHVVGFIDLEDDEEFDDFAYIRAAVRGQRFVEIEDVIQVLRHIVGLQDSFEMDRCIIHMDPPIEEITVPVGTPEEDVIEMLPDEFDVTLNNMEEDIFTVEWDFMDDIIYNPYEPGSYDLRMDADPPAHKQGIVFSSRVLEALGYMVDAISYVADFEINEAFIDVGGDNVYGSIHDNHVTLDISDAAPDDVFGEGYLDVNMPGELDITEVEICEHGSLEQGEIDDIINDLDPVDFDRGQNIISVACILGELGDGGEETAQEARALLGSEVTISGEVTDEQENTAGVSMEIILVELADDKGDLQDLVDEARALLAEVEEGDGPGQCPSDDYDTFETAVDEAEAVLDDPLATQEEVDDAFDDLSDAISAFKDAIITFTLTFDVQDEEENVLDEGVYFTYLDGGEEGDPLEEYEYLPGDEFYDDEDEEYVFEVAFTAGNYGYVVSKEGYAEASGEFTSTPEADDVHIQVTLEELPTITFVVEDEDEQVIDAGVYFTFLAGGEEGDPLEGAENIPGEDFYDSENEEYVFAVPLPDGTYGYVVSKEGYHDTTGEFEFEGEDLVIEVTLEEMPEWSFEVLDEHGEAVDNASFSYYLDLEDDPVDDPTEPGDGFDEEEGKYVFEYPPEDSGFWGLDIYYKIEAEGYETLVGDEPFVFDGDDVIIVEELSPLVWSFEVLDEHDEAVDNASFSYYLDLEDDPVEGPTDLGDGFDEEEGKYVFEYPPEDSGFWGLDIYYKIEAEGYETLVGDEPFVFDGTSVIIEETLEVLTVTFDIRDGDDQPFDNAVLSIFVGEDPVMVTDPGDFYDDGVYVIPEVPGGTYGYIISAEGYEDYPGEEPAEFKVEGESKVIGPINLVEEE